MLFVCYPRCSTCQKAQRWLESRDAVYAVRHIKDEPPTAAELLAWRKRSGLPMRRFFNTSGLRYKELGLKDKLSAMTETEMAELLATDGMLVKRPLLVGETFVLVGFREEVWAQQLCPAENETIQGGLT